MHGPIFLHLGDELVPSAILQGFGFVTHAMEVERLHPDALHPLAYLIVLCRLPRLIENGKGIADELVAVDFVILADVNAVVDIWLHQAPAQAIVVDDVRSSLAVEAVDEDVHQRIHILLGVPKQLVHSPRLHLVELSPSRLVLSLLEDADGLVVAEHLDVGAKHLEVRPGSNVLGIVHDVVPDEQMGSDGSPALQVAHEGLVLRTASIQRMGKAALYAAQAYDHILAGLDARWRFS